MPPTANDAVLLSAWITSSDAESFAVLVSRHADMVFGVAWRITGSRADAEDATQEAFHRLSDHAASVRGQVGGWLYTVARRLALQAVSRPYRRTQLLAASAHAVAAEPDRGREVQQAVEEALDVLPQDLREVLVRRFLEQRSQEDIAKHLGISQPTVHRRIEKAIALVRSRLGEAGLGTLVAMPPASAPANVLHALGTWAIAGGSAPAAVVVGAGWLLPLLLVLIPLCVLLTLLWRRPELPAPLAPTGHAPAAVVAATEDGAPATAPPTDPWSVQVSIELHDASMETTLDVLHWLAWTHGMGLVAVAPLHQQGWWDAGPITLRMQNRPLHEVIAAVAGAWGGTWSRHGDTLVFVRTGGAIDARACTLESWLQLRSQLSGERTHDRALLAGLRSLPFYQVPQTDPGLCFPVDAQLRQWMEAWWGADPTMTPSCMEALLGGTAQVHRMAPALFRLLAAPPPDAGEDRLVMQLDAARRGIAALALSEMGEQGVHAQVVDGLGDPHLSSIRPWMLTCLGQLGHTGDLPLLTREAENAKTGDVASALAAIWRLQPQALAGIGQDRGAQWRNEQLLHRWRQWNLGIPIPSVIPQLCAHASQGPDNVLGWEDFLVPTALTDAAFDPQPGTIASLKDLPGTRVIPTAMRTFARALWPGGDPGAWEDAWRAAIPLAARDQRYGSLWDSGGEEITNWMASHARRSVLAREALVRVLLTATPGRGVWRLAALADDPVLLGLLRSRWQEHAEDRPDLAAALAVACHPRTAAWVATLIRTTPDQELGPLLQRWTAPAPALALIDRLSEPLAMGHKRRILRHLAEWPVNALVQLTLCEHLQQRLADDALQVVAAQRQFGQLPDCSTPPAVEQAQVALVLAWMGHAVPAVRAAGCQAASRWSLRHDLLTLRLLDRLLVLTHDEQAEVAGNAVQALRRWTASEEGYVHQAFSLWGDVLAGEGDVHLQRAFADDLAAASQVLSTAPAPPPSVKLFLNAQDGEEDVIPDRHGGSVPDPVPAATVDPRADG